MLLTANVLLLSITLALAMTLKTAETAALVGPRVAVCMRRCVQTAKGQRAAPVPSQLCRQPCVLQQDVANHKLLMTDVGSAGARAGQLQAKPAAQHSAAAAGHLRGLVSATSRRVSALLLLLHRLASLAPTPACLEVSPTRPGAYASLSLPTPMLACARQPAAMPIARARRLTARAAALGGTRLQPRRAASRLQPRRRAAAAVRAEASVSLHFLTSFVCFYTAWTWLGLRRARIQVRPGQCMLDARPCGRAAHVFGCNGCPLHG